MTTPDDALDAWGPTPSGPSPTLTDNIRAEIARSGASVTDLRTRLFMSDSTWQRRMTTRPDQWTYGELRVLADALRVPLKVLIP